ncbi:MAG: T9SS type A sorting domain-containing protein [Bacteroidales bacterium]|nr:T9SS type A sorting domain-containing protein [Bacteroidales bacterium]
MKKVLSFVLCCVIGISAFAQQDLSQRYSHKGKFDKQLNFRPAEKMAKSADYNYRLASYNTDDLYITCEYHYDAYRRLVAVHELVPSEYELIDSIRYNEQNQLVRLDGYQKMGASWTNVYFIEYTYNAQGLIASRSNYNNFGGIFELGGTYDYTYNEAGQIIHTELTMGDMVYQTVDYEYENGLLATETWSYSNPFSQSGEFEPAERMSYTYNNSGNLTLITYETYDGISDWGLYGTRTYTYNEVGNCTEMHAYDADENETERSIFTYDNRLLEETLMPWTPEMTRPETFNNKNIYTLEEYWALDVDFVLQYVCDYEYNYVGIDEGVGLADVEQLPLTITPNPTENIIVLSGLAEGTHQMEIVDMAGRIVMSDNVSNSKQIDLSELQKGCYLVKVMNNQNLYTSKVIVK